MPAEPVKCVVWDLDGTIWPEVAVELPAGQRPRPYPAALAAIALLERRGIVNSIASRTDPSVAGLIDGDPGLAGRFVAGQLGWGHKSDAVRRVAGELGIAPAAIAFVDDDPFERAEVAALLPGVLVLAPAELYDQLDTPRFRPPVVTEDARHRLARYRQEQQRRRAEASFDGDREAFLRACRIRLTVEPATAADLDRLAELVARTHRFNSTGAGWPRDRLAELVDDPRWLVPVARLTDRFGDYGLIGAALVERADDPRLHLFTVSCRAIGRGAPGAFLHWVMGWARAGGAGRLLMDVRPQQANLELRVLLRSAGFDRTAEGGLLARRLDADPPAPPPWLTVTAPRPETRQPPKPVEPVIRGLLAEALGVERPVVDRLPATTDLLHGPLPLGSLAGARLLAAIRDRLGVDIAAEDLALDCLRSIESLCSFVSRPADGSVGAPVSGRRSAGPAPPG